MSRRPTSVAADRRTAPARDAWGLDPAVTFLNHGSYGACPIAVLEAQAAWRARLEAEPVRFLAHELEGHLDRVRDALGAFIHADPEGLAFVPNATTGVATVLGSLRFEPGDEILSTDHEYNATLNILDNAAARDGARLILARIPFPIGGPDQAIEAILGAVTPRTRLVLVSHLTSPTAVILPVERLVRELTARGIDTLVDGAHAPGQVPLDVDALGAAYYTGNAHKWLCAPKGAGFLWVRADRRDRIRPLVTSHGANSTRTDRSRFRLTFDWTGTSDPTAVLSIPTAIEVMASLEPGGWPAVMAANHALALQGRDSLSRALGTDPPAPDDMLGAMAALPVPALAGATDAQAEAASVGLLRDRGVEVPIGGWPVRAARAGGPTAAAGHVLLRISAQRYLGPSDYEPLADWLATLGQVA